MNNTPEITYGNPCLSAGEGQPRLQLVQGHYRVLQMYKAGLFPADQHIPLISRDDFMVFIQDGNSERVYIQKSLLFKTFVQIESSKKSGFYLKRPIFL